MIVHRLYVYVPRSSSLMVVTNDALAGTHDCITNQARAQGFKTENVPLILLRPSAGRPLCRVTYLGSLIVRSPKLPWGVQGEGKDVMLPMICELSHLPMQECSSTEDLVFWLWLLR